METMSATREKTCLESKNLVLWSVKLVCALGEVSTAGVAMEPDIATLNESHYYHDAIGAIMRPAYGRILDNS